MYPCKQIKSRWQIPVLILLFVVCVFFSGCVKKPQEEKVYHVGILCGLDYIAAITDGFKGKMAELGYIEGRNIVYDVQRTNFEPDKERQALERFIKDKADLIFTFPTEVSMAAKEATRGTEVPVIFAIANIEGTGLVDSVGQPGGYITGVRYPGPDLAIKRFEVMRELAPDARRMWVPYQRNYPIVANQLEALHPVAEAVGVKLIEFPADDAAEIQAELDARSKGGIGFDAMLFIPEPLSCTDDVFAVMCRFAYKHKMPIGGILMQAGDCGSIFGINVDILKTSQQAAILADKILQGTPAGTIPVVSSESFLQVNYKVAEELEITMPEGILSRADEIIR